MARDFQHSGSTIDRGYWVAMPKTDPKNKKANAYLENGDQQRIYLWVSDVMTEYGLGGTQAQSRNKRQFFPRNFNAPNVRVMGQMPNSYQYNRLAEFVRDSQVKALFGEKSFMTRFVLFGGGRHAKRNQKGTHRPWYLYGYIKMIEAGAERYKNAPDFQFEIITVENQIGLYDDARFVYNASQIRRWTQNEMFNTSQGYIRDPDHRNPSPLPSNAALPDSQDVDDYASINAIMQGR